MPFNKNTCQYLSLWLVFTTFFSPYLQAQQVANKENQGVSIEDEVPFVPVELLDFSGFYNETKHRVTLSWQTGDEKDSKTFLIERRKALEDNWDMLGFISANGKAALYEFKDVAALPLNYYRLRTVDKMGKFSLSHVISVSKDDTGKLKVYPKIAKDSLLNIIGIEIVDKTSENQKLATFTVFNVLGQHVIQGKTRAQIDISILPRGIYLLKIGQNEAKFLRQ